ncbi:MAG: pseudouridine synthase [Anaerolineae bacterium]
MSDEMSPAAAEPLAGVRLQKVLAQAGICSRRACEALIAAGRVAVNGRQATLGQRVVAGDSVTLDGKPVPLSPQGLVYYALYKPRGIVSTARDDRGRQTVLDLVPAGERVYPVGRLDVDSEGLVLLTNDGELALRLSHPRYQIPKVYEVWVRGQVSDKDLDRVRQGVRLEDGWAKAVEATAIGAEGDISRLRVVMTEGRKHEVRRLLWAVGHEVVRLRRTAIGVLELAGLSPGEWRALSATEVAAMRAAAGATGRAHLGESR